MPPLLRRLARGVRAAWLACGLTVLALVGAEVVARAILALRAPAEDHRVHADTYGDAPWVRDFYRENAASAVMRWEPYTYWRRREFAGRYINIDAQGHRRTWRSSAPGPALRVAVLGGSTVWGTGVRDDHTMPSELAQALDARGVHVEVANLGESGYVSTQAVIALLRELQQGRVPDLALFYFGVNDIFSVLQNGAAGLPQNEAHRERELNLTRRGWALAREAALDLPWHSVILRALVPARAPEPPRVLGKHELDELLRTVDANVRAAQGLARAYGFEVNFVWEPCLFRKPARTAWEAARLNSGESQHAWFDRAYDRVRADWSTRDPAEFLDLEDVFAATHDPRFLDLVHLGEQGTRDVAVAIAEHLIAHGRLHAKRPPPA